MAMPINYDKEIAKELTLKLLDKVGASFSISGEEGFSNPEQIGKAFQSILKAVKEAE